MSLVQRFAVAADQLWTSTPRFRVVTRSTGVVERRRSLASGYHGGSR
jgi:hypothetical protein